MIEAPQVKQMPNSRRWEMRRWNGETMLVEEDSSEVGMIGWVWIYHNVWDILAKDQMHFGAVSWSKFPRSDVGDGNGDNHFYDRLNKRFVNQPIPEFPNELVG